MRTSLSLSPLLPSGAPSRSGLVVACVAGALLLPACGGADDSSAGSNGTDGEQTTQSSGQSGKSGSGESTGAPEQAAEVAPADLANFQCAQQDDGRWKATGDIRNPAKQPMVYTVTVVTVDGEDEVLGERVKSFEIGPEDRASFTWPKFFRGSAERCMPHVEREPA